MINSYPFGQVFQLKLLALLVQQPEKVLDIVDSRYFDIGNHKEVARIAIELYAKYLPRDPHFRLDYESLKEAVYATETDTHRRHNFKRLLKDIFTLSPDNSPLLIDQTRGFITERRYREALVAAEKDIANLNYVGVHERIEKLRPLMKMGSIETSMRALRNSLRQQMHNPLREVEWDVPGFFPARATILFGGRKREGKSYLLQALGKASRKGSELIKRLPVAKKSFLYLVREGAQELYDQRFREFEFDYRKHSRKFQLWGPWMEPIPPKILERGTPYSEWAKEFAPCSIAIDGLRRFFDGDENSSEAMDPVGQELTTWANNGATVYIAHHRGKSKNIDSRGSSAIEDFVSVQYVVEALREGQRISKIRVRCVKNWYGEEKALLLVPHWGAGKFWFTGGEATEAEDRWARDKEMVLSQTSVTEWVPRATIFEALEGEMGRDRIIEILDSESGKNGKLRAKRSSKPGAPFQYRRLTKAKAETGSDSGDE